jgi:hypothetical protein
LKENRPIKVLTAIAICNLYSGTSALPLFGPLPSPRWEKAVTMPYGLPLPPPPIEWFEVAILDGYIPTLGQPKIKKTKINRPAWCAFALFLYFIVSF